ncbi:UNVERIFIED_ORG: hypothetical protein ABIB52_002921 [Arthrobacter sp. UYCu721]
MKIPVDWTLDDWEQYAFYPGVTCGGVIESPAKVLEMWTLEAEAHHAQGSRFVLTNHPFISGRPSKAVALEKLIERVKCMDGMWVTTMEEIAEHARRTVEEVHTHARIEVPSRIREQGLRRPRFTSRNLPVSTAMTATPVSEESVRTYLTSTPAPAAEESSISPLESSPTAPKRRTSPPSRLAATAWLALLPPGFTAKPLPCTVSPSSGSRSQ